MSGQLKIQMPMGSTEAYGMTSKSVKTELVSIFNQSPDWFTTFVSQLQVDQNGKGRNGKVGGSMHQKRNS